MSADRLFTLVSNNTGTPAAGISFEWAFEWMHENGWALVTSYPSIDELGQTTNVRQFVFRKEGA
jgi:hypothetical protein